MAATPIIFLIFSIVTILFRNVHARCPSIFFNTILLHKVVFLADFFDPIAEAAVTPRDAQGCMVTMREGLVTIVDSETLEDQMLPSVSREAFVKNRNLLYALVADGPLCG